MRFSVFFFFFSLFFLDHVFFIIGYTHDVLLCYYLSLSLSVDLLLNSVCKCGKVASAKKRRRETNRCNFERRDLLDE